MQAIRVANVVAPRMYAPPRRPVFAGPRYAPVPAPPPMLGQSPHVGAERPRLGEFAWGRLPTSILFMTGGVAGLYIGGAFPSPVDVILKAVGVAAVGWGVYYLFNEPPKGGAEKPSGAEQEPQRTPSPTAFQLIKGNIISPTPGSKPSLNFWGDTYDAQVVWYNGSNENVDFTYDLYADVRVPGLPSAQVTPGRSVYTKTVKLKPGEDSGPITITLPIVRPEKPFESFGAPARFWNELTLRKYDAQANPVPVTAPIRVGPFDYFGAAVGATPLSGRWSERP